MTPRIVTIMLIALLVAGCGENPQPTRRTIADQPNQKDPHGGMPKPHGAMPGQMARPPVTGPEVRLGSMVMTAPDGWQRKQPRSPQITLAEFSLPAAEGDTNGGRLTISHVGGNIDALMDYWRRQFIGNPTEEPQETKEISGVSVVVVGLSGTFSGQRQESETATQHAGHRMRAAIFSVGSRPFVVKCVGPKKTMANSEDAFMAFLDSLKRPEPPSTKMEPVKPKSPATPDATEPDATEPEPPQPETPAPDATEPATESESSEGETPAPETPAPEAP